MVDEKTFTKEFRESLENKRIGSNLLGILNDIKRRPSDAAKELGISKELIENIINGKSRLSSKIISKAIKIWPVNARDFYIMHDDCPSGLKIMRCEDSMKSSRIMHRGGKPYYEYRDTAMSSVGPFRPEWIEELCVVDDNELDNRQVQWNNGHFMHQFTYFVGDVNFYYIDENGEIYSKNWLFDDPQTSFQTIMDKIYYVRWGNRSDNFYFRAGSLPSVTLGYGALVERYSNSIEYPQVKKLGLDLIYGNEEIKFEYVQSDFKSTPGLMALYTTFNITPRTNLFLTLAHDLNQLARLDEIPSNISYDDLATTCSF